MSPFVIRPATSADYDAFVALVAELGLPDDPVPDRAAWEREWLPATLILERDGATAGYTVLRILRRLAYVFHLVTHPDHRRRGVGRALLEELAARGRAAGCTTWSLNVKADNVAAIRLYEAMGMRATYRAWALRLAWVDVARLPREEGVFSVRPIEPAEDAAIEGAFPIPGGRLADLRASRERLPLRLVDGARPEDPRAGVACFDAAFPGAFPFHVARPALAAPLLLGIRPYARPGDAHLDVMVPVDEALAATLRAAGAELRFELLHMEGPLP
jgi:ribosomal protein S18 acetylase RimI-like enzyme